MNKVCTMLAVVGLAALNLGSLETHAETYPTRPVRVIVPGPAGGGLDTIARVVVQGLSESGQNQFYVDNLPGAGGAIGTGTAAKAPADGYTVLIMSQDFVIHPLIKSKVPYDAFASFAPVTVVAAAPEVLVVNPSVPAKNLQELIHVLKARPGKYNYATPGHGTSPHLASERLFKLTFGTDVVHVPFQGAPPALASTIAGDTQILHLTLPLVLPHIRSGELRPLALASEKRVTQLQDVPTLAEAGISGHEVGFWVGMMVPTGTPSEIVQWLRTEIKRAIWGSTAKSKLEAVGFELIASTADELRNRIKAEYARWGKVVEEAKIQKN